MNFVFRIFFYGGGEKRGYYNLFIYNRGIKFSIPIGYNHNL